MSSSNEWYRWQAGRLGYRVVQFLRAADEGYLINLARLAAHFGRLALGQTHLHEELFDDLSY